MADHWLFIASSNWTDRPRTILGGSVSEHRTEMARRTNPYLRNMREWRVVHAELDKIIIRKRASTERITFKITQCDGRVVGCPECAVSQENGGGTNGALRSAE